MPASYPTIQSNVIRTLIAERFQLEKLPQGSLRQELSQGITYVTEIMLKIVTILQTQKQNAELADVVTNADKMLALQFESAKQIMEFQRILALVGAAQHPIQQHGNPQEHTAKLRQDNLAALRGAIAEAEVSIGAANRKLVTLLLQIAQMEQQVSDLVMVAHVTEETTATLRSLQAVVDAQRETVQEFVRWTAP